MVSVRVLPSLQATHGIKLAFLRAGANIESRLKMAQAGSGGGGEENKYHVTEAERVPSGRTSAPVRSSANSEFILVLAIPRCCLLAFTARGLYLLSPFRRPPRPLALSQSTMTPVNMEISHANCPAAPCRCRSVASPYNHPISSADPSSLRNDSECGLDHLNSVLDAISSDNCGAQVAADAAGSLLGDYDCSCPVYTRHVRCAMIRHSLPFASLRYVFLRPRLFLTLLSLSWERHCSGAGWLADRTDRCLIKYKGA